MCVNCDKMLIFALPNGGEKGNFLLHNNKANFWQLKNIVVML